MKPKLTFLSVITVVFCSVFTLACSTTQAKESDQALVAYHWKEAGKVKTLWLDTGKAIEFDKANSDAASASAKSNVNDGATLINTYRGAKLWAVPESSTLAAKALSEATPAMAPVLKFSNKPDSRIASVQKKLLIEFAKGVTEVEKSALWEKHQLTIVNQIPSIGYYQVAAQNNAQLLQTMDALSESALIRTVTPDFWRPVELK